MKLSGVYSEEQCRSGWGLLNHAVLVVGYGTDPVGGDYWLVKNRYISRYRCVSVRIWRNVPSG